MPKIPEFTSTAGPGQPYKNINSVMAPTLAMAEIGEQLGSVIKQINDKKKETERFLKATDIERAIDEEVDTFADGIGKDTDFMGYEPKRQKFEQELNQKISTMIGDDPILMRSVEKYKSKQLSDIHKMTLAKYSEGVKKHAAGQIVWKADKLSKQFGGASDEERPIIVNEFSQFIQAQVAKGFIDPDDAEAAILKFSMEAEVERVEQDLETRVNGVLVGPDIVEQKIKNNEYDFPADVRRKVLDKAAQDRKSEDQRIKVAKNEREQDQKDYEDAMKKQEENAVADAYLSGDYSLATALIGKSKFMDARSRAVWNKDVLSASTEKDPFKNSDPEYSSKLFEDAAGGLVEPDSIIPVPNKLSKADATMARTIAKMATNPEKKHITDLMKSVIKQSNALVMGAAWYYEGADTEQVMLAGEAERFIMTSINNASSDAERIELLDQTSKKFILPLALQGKRLYKPTTPNPLFMPNSKQNPDKVPIKSNKSLWGEK